MEKKTTQRITGLLVVLALIIITLPLLFSGNETQVETAAIKAPPFPAEHANENPTVVAMQSQPEPVVISAEDANAISQHANAPEPTSTQVTPPPTPQQSLEQAPLATIKQPVENNSAAMEPQQQNEPSVAPEPPVVKKRVAVHKTQNPLTQSKTAGWVVQVGNFKVKNNAMQLANKLREAGYKAFLYEAKNGTRVYVGPEFQQTSAVALANKIQQELNMHGVLVNYKPLEL